MWIVSSLPLPPGPLESRSVAPVCVPYMGQIELFNHLLRIIIIIITIISFLKPCCCALVLPFQQPLEGPMEVLLCERVNDLRHGLIHLLNCLITRACELRE